MNTIKNGLSYLYSFSFCGHILSIAILLLLGDFGGAFGVFVETLLFFVLPRTLYVNHKRKTEPDFPYLPESLLGALKFMTFIVSLCFIALSFFYGASLATLFAILTALTLIVRFVYSLFAPKTNESQGHEESSLPPLETL